MTDSSKFEIPQSLQQAITKQTCVPFVGAGLSMTIKSTLKDEEDKYKPLFCSWKELLLQAAEKLKQNHKPQAANAIESALDYIEDDSYYRAAKTAKKELGTAEFNAFLKQTFNKKQIELEPSSLDTAKLVWQLGSQLVITTNYDKVLQWASPDQDHQTINIDAEFELSQLCQTEPDTDTVLHLHGSVDNIGKIVLTPDGYQALYGDEFTQAQHQAALTTLKTLLIRKTLIFIGFSFADQSFYQQIKLINDIFEGNGPKHYVLCRESQKADIERLGLPLETVCYKTYDDLPKLLSELAALTKEKEKIKEKDKNNDKPTVKTQPIEQPKTTPAQEKPNLDNTIFFMPFRAKGKGVIGRDDKLIELHSQLQSGTHTSIGHAAGFKGMGGVGKTQLAIEYAHNYQRNYPKGVIWLTADQDIEPQLIACAKQANWVSQSSEDKDTLAIAINRIRSYNDSLIIFDNVETKQSIERYLPNVDATPHLLMTTRNIITGFNPVELDSLTPDAALQLLCNEAGQSTLTNGLTDDELTAANTLCQQLGFLPLAIEIAGAHIKHNLRHNFVSYLNAYEQDFNYATKPIGFDSFTKHEQCLISTLKLSDEITTAHPTLIKVMQILAYSANAAMGESLLAFMLYGEPCQFTPIKLATSLDTGRGLNLIAISEQHTSNPRYSLHRLVKRVQLELTPFTNNLTWCQQLADNMVHWFKPIREEFNHLALFQLEQPHLEIWADYAAKQHWPQQPALIWLQAYPLWHLGHYQQAKALLDQAQTALKSFEQLQNSALTADIFNDYGNVLYALGDYQQALEYGEKALNLRETLFGKNHEDVARSFSNLSSCYSKLGQYDQALIYGQKALEMHIAIFGDDHPDVANSYNNLSSCYSNLGQYDQALKHCQKALEMRVAIYGEHHPKVATSYNNLDGCYSNLDQYDQALTYCKKALDMHIAIFGEHHPTVANSYGNLSSRYHNLGHYDQALKYCQKALEMRIAIFGEHHPDVATSYNNLGSCYYRLNDNQTALTHEQKAFKLRLDLLGPQHPKTLLTFKNKQQTLIDLKRFQPAMTAISNYRQQLPKSHAYQKELNKLEKHLNIQANKNNVRLVKAGQNAQSKKSKKGKRR